jgi:butyryl-CoA dehydrogenase
VQRELDNGAKKADQNFYQGKMFTLRYFFAYELPKTLGLAKRLLDDDRMTVEMRADFFND